GHQPLRLRELHIKNFRGIDELHVELSLPITVFAGANGMGKTSILEAALICTGGLNLLPDDMRPFSQQVRAGADDFELRAVLDIPEQGGTREVVFRKPISGKNRLRPR